MRASVEDQAYERFREDLREALNHLHDPDYRPSDLLSSVVAGDQTANAVSVQMTILEAIAQLAPPKDTPDTAGARRSHDVLRLRFVQRLTQEQTAEKMHLTVRSIRREQRVATHMLARYLWEHRLIANDDASLVQTAPTQPTDTTVSSLTWHAQARRELASLRADNPSAVADVAAVVGRAVDLERALMAGHGIELTVGPLDEALTAAVHPMALRQALIMALGLFSRASLPGEVVVDTMVVDEAAHIRLTGPGFQQTKLETNLLSEILQLQDGQLIVSDSDDQARMTLAVPAVGKVTVVIVDDNDDFVHFCRRCVRGTRYRICPPTGRTLDDIKSMDPDVILLDIMLPDIDGWEILGQLHQDPETASIPVIICSIMPEDELASLMGAVSCLPKPVQHQQLISTLDQVVGTESL